MFLPEDDRYSYSKRHLESQLSSLFGGRIAEELIFGEEAVTTGASNDIENDGYRQFLGTGLPWQG